MRSSSRLFITMTLIGLSLSAAFMGCSTPAPKTGDSEAHSNATPAGPGALTREEAAIRSRQVNRVAYRLWFGLGNDDGSDGGNFDGRTHIQFHLKEKAKDASETLFLDFEEGEIRSIQINGKPVTAESGAFTFNTHRILFPVKSFNSGVNEIEIVYKHPYSHSGEGLHRFKDPEDGKTYTYTDFEPYNAHRLFPCFDQPDLKATYETSALVPNDWEVISNVAEREVQATDGRKLWQFPKGAVYATYVFALHAGPYAKWSQIAKTKDGEIPMRLFARQTLKKYVDHKEWLDISEKGLDFYSKEFEYPYPFGKYDQLIVPEFNPGAMENIGAVTFSERYVYRSKVTEDTHRGRAETILHEMAHMWFGDLVTMRWWNGLWLNETFATFMSNIALDQASQFKGVWETFFGEKSWAYWTDQLVTTHSIEVPVPHTDAADSIFDGITYGKGAAAIKQLRFYLGESEFREGVRRYFKKHAFKNTSISDFIQALAEASGKDLAVWQREWLQTSGVNTFKAEWKCDPESHKISDATIFQTASDHVSILRTHKTQLGFYFVNGGKVKLKKTFDVVVKGARTEVPALLKEKCPDFIFPNEGDYAYAKLDFSDSERAFVLKHLSQFDTTLTRQLLWQVLWEDVVDGKLSATDFAEAVFKHGTHETFTPLLSSLIERVGKPRGSSALTAIKVTTGEKRETLRKQVEEWTWKELHSSPKGSDRALIWFQGWAAAVHTPGGLEHAKRMLTAKESIPSGIKLETDRQWELVGALVRNSYPTSEEATALLQDEKKKDPSDNGLRAAMGVEVQLPTLENKKAWFKQLSEAKSADGKTLSGGRVRSAMNSFNILGQENLSKNFVGDYFAFVEKLGQDRSLHNDSYRGRFVNGMFPSLCEQDIVDRTAALLKKNLPSLEESLRKDLRIAKQEEERCIRARKITNP